MAPKLESLLRSATISLTDAAGSLLGTAFFVAPSLAVTAAHVVKDAIDPPRVFAPRADGSLGALTVLRRHPPAVAFGIDDYPLPDLAVLEGEPGHFDGIPCALLGQPGEPGKAKELIALGYSSAVDPHASFGPDMARLLFEGTVETPSGITVLKVQDAVVDRGMSGAPVLDNEAGAVVGFVKATRGAGKPYGAHVVAITALKTYDNTSWAQSELHHRRHANWRAAQMGELDGLDPTAATRLVLDGVLHAAEQRNVSLPQGVDVAAVHQTIWLRRRSPGPDSRSRSTASTSSALRQRWRVERPLTGLTVISGDPGLGKSWLLSHHASHLAGAALDHLDAEGTSERCTVPVQLTCAVLASGIESDTTSRQLAEVLVDATVSELTIGSEARRGCVRAIEQAWTAGRLVVCLDGLDEMPIGLLSKFKLGLILLLSKGNAVLVGSRPAALAIIDDIAADSREDFELVGFSFRETVNFVRAWHAADTPAADALLGALADRGELARLAEVPLLLSFFCRLAEGIRDRGYQTATLSQLYQDVAFHLLSGQWSNRAPTDRQAVPDAVLRMRLLSRSVGSLQDTWGGSVEDIAKADLGSAIRGDSDYVAVAATATLRRQEHLRATGGDAAEAGDEPVLWELLHDGILVEATAAVGLRPMVRFIHPVVREVVLADYVAGLSLDEQRACVDRHRWLDPGWVRVIVMAVRRIEDASALVAHILDPASLKRISGGHEEASGDPWVTQRTIAAQLIAESRPYADDVTARQVLEEVLAGAASNLTFERRRAVAAAGILVRSESQVLRRWGWERARRLSQGVPTNGDGEASAAVVTPGSDTDNELTYEVVASLVEAGDDVGAEPAVVLLGSKTCPTKVRTRLISALVARNLPASTGPVLELLESGTADVDDLAAFLAGLQPQADLAVDVAVRLLRNRQMKTSTRVEVARALLECGPTGADEVRAVAGDRTNGWSVQCQLYAELLRAAVPGVTEPALRLLANPNPRFADRAQLTLALIEDGVVDALPDAALLLINPHVYWGFRRTLAQALVRLGSVGRDLLVSQLDHGAIGLDVKVRHICALVEVDDDRGLTAAIKLHSDRGVSLWIRHTLADVLLRHHPGLVDEEALLELATSVDIDVDRRLHTLAEMLRSGMTSAEAVLPSVLRESDWIRSSAELFRRLAESGPTGHRCLDALARNADIDWSIRCDALLGLGRRLSAGFPNILMHDAAAALPEIWQNRLVLGLAREGLAPDLDRFLNLASTLPGGYRILFEYLKRAPLHAATLDRSLAAARHMQSDTSRIEVASTDGGGSGFVLNRELLEGLGVEIRSAEEIRIQLNWLYRTVEARVGEHLARLMLSEQLDEFETFIDDDDEAGALDWLEAEMPEYKSVVREVVETVKADVRSGALVPPVFDDTALISSTAPLTNISRTASVLAERLSGML